jgi:hypothetical protein
MSKPFRLIAISLALALVAPSTSAAASPTPTEDRPELAQGDELEALRDLEIRGATLRKGARVRVVHIAREDRRITSVSLELADGHVLTGVPYDTVKKSFRRVAVQ